MDETTSPQTQTTSTADVPALVPVAVPASAAVTVPAADPLLDVVLRFGGPLQRGMEAAEASQNDPIGSLERWRGVLALALECRDALASCGLDQEKYERLVAGASEPMQGWIERVVLLAVNASTALQGRLAYAEGQAAALQGHFAVAAERYENASTLLKEFKDASWYAEAEFYWTYARVLSSFMRGNDQARLQALSDAASSFQIGRARLKNELYPLLDRMERDGADFSAAKRQLRQLEIPALNIAFVNHIMNERFEDARSCAATIQIVAQEAYSADPSDLAEVPPEFRARFAGIGDALTALGKAYVALSTGEIARTERRWDDAEVAYASATEMMHDAAQAAASMEDIPLFRDLQTMLNNTSMLVTARQRMAENRKLVQEADQLRLQAERDRADAAAWRTSLTAVGSAPVAVSATATSGSSSNASAMTEVTVKNVISVAIQQVADDVDQLAALIARSSLSPADKALLAGKAADAKAATAEKADGFFKKVADFAETAAKLLKGAQDAAEPLGKVLRWVAPLVPAAVAMLGAGHL